MFKVKEARKYNFDQSLLVTDNWPSSPDELSERDYFELKGWKDYFLFYMIKEDSKLISPHFKFNEPVWKMFMGCFL